MWDGHIISIAWMVRLDKKWNVKVKKASQVTVPYEAYSKSLWQVFLFVRHA